ncbi:hypothetical protein DFA_02853 [Cavenderia fasciculata]|uniref:Uncharacterized protein n=1 Tax=Cavenderia fasciculata TaxID=261658 RepID=F4PIN0_CACFS|nr:uncharacterized protein DFA_02853 [Cavenderia fasciculata]EGG24610.1 hypothetical protein DFA_02853 [Cavenderia fasciculata]|eukprot:XP_004362461.1 hypothetical protein DFA_02853 [Cavenderia fasciculata]
MIVNAAPIVYPPPPLKINSDEAPSLVFLLKQYGMNWTFVDNVLSNYSSNSTKAVNGSFTSLYMSPTKGIPFKNSGVPDKSLGSLYFPNLTLLRIESLCMDCSINILEMVKDLSNLDSLTILTPSVPYIPDGFPFSLTKLTRLSIIEFKESIPDGFGEDLMLTLLLSHYDSVPVTPKLYIDRIPDSLCTGRGMNLAPLPDSAYQMNYMAQCFSCYSGHFNSLMFLDYFGFDYPCDSKVTSLYYRNQSSNNLLFDIGGNNLLMSLYKIKTDGDLGSIEDRVMLGSNEIYSVTIPVSFTRINLGNIISIDQQPFGINLLTQLNYNIYINHTISLNGVVCEKNNTIYLNDTLSCYFPLVISSPSTILNLNIRNIRNSEINQFNFKRRMCINLKKNEYIELNGEFGMIIPTISMVMINESDCFILNINSTNLECNFTLGELDKEKATKANKLQLAREEKEAQERREKRQRDIASGLIPPPPDVPVRTGNICKVLGQIKKSVPVPVPNAGLFNSYCHHRGAKQPIDPNDSMWGGFADSYSRAYKDYKKYLLSNPRGDMTADDHRTMYFNTIFLPSDQQTATADQDPTVHHPDTENPPVASPPPSESFGGNDDQLFGDNSCHLEPTPPLEYGAMCDSSFDTPPMAERFDTSVTDRMEIESPSSQQTEEKNKRSNEKDGGDKRKDHPVTPEQDGDDEEIVEQPKKKTKPNTQISKVAITTKKKPSSEKKSVVKESSSDSGEEEEDHPKKKKKSLAKKPVVEDSSDSEDEESDQSDSDDDTTKGAPHKAVNRTPIKQRKGKSGVGTPKNKSQKKNASALTRLTSFYKNSKEARPLLKRLLEQGSRGFVVDKVHRPADPKATYYCDFSIHLPGLKETSERIPGIATKCKFEPKTSTGFPGGGLVLGANEKIFNSDGSVYNSGGGGGTTPLDTKGVTFQTDGIHLTTNQNVYNSDGTPINNSPPPLNTQGVTFNTDGVHLAPGQNVFKSDGTPISNGSQPLDTKGLVFTTQGPTLATGQKIYNQDGSVYQDTRGVVFGQDGIHLLAGQNVYDSDGVPLDNAPLPLDTEGVVFTPQGPKLAAGQSYLLADGTPLQPVVNNVTNVNFDTKGVTFQDDGLHMLSGQNIYKSDGTTYGVDSRLQFMPFQLTETIEVTPFRFGVSSSSGSTTINYIDPIKITLFTNGLQEARFHQLETIRSMTKIEKYVDAYFNPTKMIGQVKIRVDPSGWVGIVPSDNYSSIAVYDFVTIYPFSVSFIDSSINPDINPPPLIAAYPTDGSVYMRHASGQTTLAWLRCLRIGGYFKVGLESFRFTGPYNGTAGLIYDLPAANGHRVLPPRFRPPTTQSVIGVSTKGHTQIPVIDQVTVGDVTRCTLRADGISIQHKDSVNISMILSDSDYFEVSGVFWEWIVDDAY